VRILTALAWPLGSAPASSIRLASGQPQPPALVWPLGSPSLQHSSGLWAAPASSKGLASGQSQPPAFAGNAPSAPAAPRRQPYRENTEGPCVCFYVCVCLCVSVCVFRAPALFNMDVLSLFRPGVLPGDFELLHRLQRWPQRGQHLLVRQRRDSRAVSERHFSLQLERMKRLQTCTMTTYTEAKINRNK
jgi:hypothetical protein